MLLYWRTGRRVLVKPLQWVQRITPVLNSRMKELFQELSGKLSINIFI